MEKGEGLRLRFGVATLIGGGGGGYTNMGGRAEVMLTQTLETGGKLEGVALPAGVKII